MRAEGQSINDPPAVENSEQTDAVWTRLYEIHRQEMVAYFRAHIGLHGDIEDFVQDVFTHLLMHKQIPENPRVYIYAIARHLLCVHWRKRNMRTAVEQAATAVVASAAADHNGWRPEPGPLEQVCLQESEQIITCTLARLPAAFAEVLRLTVLEGLSLGEAAHRVGCSREVMKKRFQRARRRFRELCHETSV